MSAYLLICINLRIVTLEPLLFVAFEPSFFQMNYLNMIMIREKQNLKNTYNPCILKKSWKAVKARSFELNIIRADFQIPQVKPVHTQNQIRHVYNQQAMLFQRNMRKLLDNCFSNSTKYQYLFSYNIQ